jgi:hypothetical protein
VANVDDVGTPEVRIGGAICKRERRRSPHEKNLSFRGFSRRRGALLNKNSIQVY